VKFLHSMKSRRFRIPFVIRYMQSAPMELGLLPLVIKGTSLVLRLALAVNINDSRAHSICFCCWNGPLRSR
jgi:hypothetical protein